MVEWLVLYYPLRYVPGRPVFFIASTAAILIRQENNEDQNIRLFSRFRFAFT